MPKQTVKSVLATMLGGKAAEALNNHKSDETVYGGGSDLPEGIDSGVAQLAECKFDTYTKGDNKGKPYFYAAGIVKSPKFVNGVHIEGLRTSVMEALYDTPKRSRPTVDDHMSWVLNEFRKLGVNTDEFDGVEDMGAAAEALKEAAPHFLFRTWKGEKTKEFPNPRVNHEWRGLTEYVGGEEDAVVDETPDEEEDEEEEKPAPKGKAGKASKGKKAVKAEEEDEELDDSDPKALGKAADKGDKDAEAKLVEIAEEHEIDPEEFSTWADVAKAILEAAEGSEEEEADEEWEPVKEKVYKYKPPKAKKALDVEVTQVFASKKLVNLKNLDDGKPFKGVAWDDLIREE